MNVTTLIYASHCLQDIVVGTNIKVLYKFAAALQCLAASNTYLLLGADGDMATVTYWLKLNAPKKSPQDYYFKNEYA